ncbi:hypothetical protein HYT84_00930 [Candidatus Micrarchaeota archaeon]|nr:hypothetical protein [Candidatus Micrarchaeota archaeon]
MHDSLRSDVRRQLAKPNYTKRAKVLAFAKGLFKLEPLVEVAVVGVSKLDRICSEQEGELRPKYLTTVRERASFSGICRILKGRCSPQLQKELVEVLSRRYGDALEIAVSDLARYFATRERLADTEISFRIWIRIESPSDGMDTVPAKYLELYGVAQRMKMEARELFKSDVLTSERAKELVGNISETPRRFYDVLVQKAVAQV